MLLPLLGLAASIALVECQHTETRQTYDPYPADAADLLAEEVADVGAPIALEVVTSMAVTTEGQSTAEVWDLLKGMVHRLRNQNQIIHANPHFYISNGLDLGCRVLQMDEDTGFESEIEVLPVPPQCVGACTNHGRYCSVQEESFDPTIDNQRGAMLVEETLRRLCVSEIYHGSDLRWWEYMEAFEHLDCRKATDMNACAMRAVDVVPHIDYGPIDACMHLAGGLQEDGENVRLKKEMDKSHGNHPYALGDIPFIRVGGKKLPHAVRFDTAHIFEFVCSVYQEEKAVTPIACAFCSSCRMVRPCLWQLQCDGRPFFTSAFQNSIIEEWGETSSPPPTPAPQMAVAAPEPTYAPTTSPRLVTDAPVAITTEEPPQTQQSPSPVSNDNNNNSTTTSGIADSPLPNTEQPSAAPTDELVSESAAEEPSNAPTTAPSASELEEAEKEEPDKTAALGSNYYDESDEQYADNDEEADDDYHHEEHPFLIYGVPVLVAAGLLGLYFLLSFLRQRYHERKVNSAEEYFNDLMNESYRDNMAVSGRIDDDASDRMEEDVGYGAPPTSSFKVHMVMS